MNILDMALRNLGRNRRRSFLAILSVFMSMLIVMFADAFISGVLDSIVRNATKNQTGHVNVATADYRKRERFMPATAALADSDALSSAIMATPGLEGMVAELAPRVQFGTVLSSGTQTKAALGIGGVPELERRLLMLDRSIQSGGTYLDAPGSAIVGSRLAEDLGLKVGDYLKVVAQKADYGLGFKKFRISGIFRTGLELVDSSTFQVRIDDARELLGLGKGASEILVMLKDYRKSDAAAAMITAALASAQGREGAQRLSVQSWTSIGDVARIVSMTGTIYFWIELVIAFLGAFIIANVMMMVVLERKREIGIMKSMGMERGSILALFLAEGTLLGLIGSAAAALSGILLNSALAVKGIDFSRNTGGTGIPMDSIIHPEVHPLNVLALFCLGVLISAIVAYLPSRSAAVMGPIEAIRSA